VKETRTAFEGHVEEEEEEDEGHTTMSREAQQQNREKHLLEMIRNRESGSRNVHSGKGLRRHICKKQARAFTLSEDRFFKTPSPATLENVGVAALDLELAEGRYLLAGGADGSISALDVLSHSYNSEGKEIVHNRLFYIERGIVHRAAVSNIQWFPVDSGTFASSSTDGELAVWDANELSPLWRLGGKEEIYSFAMSPIATSHSMLAVSYDSVVNLADIRIPDPQSSVQHFAGHKGDALVLAWSTISEWILLSGGADGQIRYWDIRRSGTLMCLDQYNTKAYNGTQVCSSSKPDLSHLQTKRLHPQKSWFLTKQYQHEVDSYMKSQKLHKKYAMSVVEANVTAHNAPIRLLQPSQDGLFLYSASDRLREFHKWDQTSGRNMLVKYSLPFEKSRSSNLRMAISQCGEEIFVPNGRNIFCLDASSGEKLYKLSGHFDTVSSCILNPTRSELYSAGWDGQILVWHANYPAMNGPEENEATVTQEHAVGKHNEDEWTSDEED